ncbi:MAG: c-type cytochrome [Terriglobia bacterium]
MKIVFRIGFAAAAAYAILTLALPQTSTAPKTLRDGVFTAEQANRGEQIYTAKCAACHGDNLAGMETAPALSGANFRKSWDGQPLLTLGNRIKATMPPFAPNSLAANQVTDVLSFILKSNEIRAGNVALSLAISGGTAGAAGSLSKGNTDWTTYGADLASTRYAPLDQINKDNFNKLQIAWRLNTNNLGPTPDRLYASTPLVVDGTLYVTAGTARSVGSRDPRD